MPIFVSNVFPPDRGGIQTMMAALAAVAAARTSDVVVVAPRAAGTDSFDQAAPYRVIRYRDGRGPVAAFGCAIAYARALTCVRDRTTFAANWWPSALLLTLVPRLMRGRMVIFAHGSDVAPEKGGLRRALMRFTFRRADVVAANSSFTCSLLERAGVTERVTVIPLGVDVAPIEPRRSAVPTILSVGRLVERKGFDKIIAAVPALATRFPDIRYEIVGSGPDRERLATLARGSGVNERVAFLGGVSDDEMAGAYARAWCFALPVRRVGSDVEGFGIVYLEAAMAQLPAIGGSYSGASDAILDGDTGFLVDGSDDAAISNALAAILEDPEAAARMGRRAFERARTFTWERTYDCVLAALAR